MPPRRDRRAATVARRPVICYNARMANSFTQLQYHCVFSTKNREISIAEQIEI